jgi:pimeloyl-ACP methyl ester carboxylesterase
MAALPQDREMIVVDRPGYGGSQPEGCVPDIRDQASALAPLLDGPRGQKILLVGQSYGAAIATLMAAARPGRVASIVLMSSYLGESGPTARWLVDVGSRLRHIIPRDLRNAVIEVSGQPPQMPLMRQALAGLAAPIHVIHGDADDFAPVELARRLAEDTDTRRPMRFEAVAAADHFLNDQPPATVISCLEACLPAPVPSAPELIGRLAAGIGRRLGSLTGAAQTDAHAVEA